MCLAIPGKVIEIKGEDKENVIVDYVAEKREVRNLFEELKIGDYVVVSGGFVIKIVPEKDALETIELIANN